MGGMHKIVIEYKDQHKRNREKHTFRDSDHKNHRNTTVSSASGGDDG
jgi:hypothetical protein